MINVWDGVIALLLFAFLVPLFVLPWIHRQYAVFGRLRGWSALLAGVEVLYVCGLVAFTLFPLPVQTVASCASRTTADHFNLNPLNDLVATRSAVLQILLNVILFVPLGYLLRYRFRAGVLVAAGIGLGVSLFIEVAQGTANFGVFACPYRVADTGDLIANTTGAVVGWLAAAATARLLPDPMPVPSADLDPPGLVRRAFAVLADLLIGFLATMAILVVLVLSGAGAARGGAVAVAVTVAVYAVTTLAVPLRRADRATLGQVVFFLTPAAERPASAVWLRFLVWWLPAALLQALQHTGWVLVAAAVLGLAARLRPDRRTPVDLLVGSATVTTRR